MKTFSKHYTDQELCQLHDKYMELYDRVIDTEFAWVLTASYSTLLEAMLEAEGANCHQAMATLTFMLVYKQNVYEIDGANDKRHEDNMLEKMLITQIRSDCNSQMWRHNGVLCIPHELQDEMGWDDSMTNGYLLQAFGSAYEYNGSEWVIKQPDTTLTVGELNNELENIDIGYYESGACYDSSRESWDEKHIEALQDKHKLTVIE